MKTQRDTTLDIVRILAFLAVVSVHFFFHSGFYGNPVGGKGMLVMVTLRAGFLVCVPLFLILSGWLCNKKTLTARYYKGILRILVSALLSGVACSIFDYCYTGGAGFAPLSILKGALHFHQSVYGWYVNMYVGLFLMIPFLNLAYHGLQTRQRKLILVVSMLLLTALPGAVNAFNLTTPGWWADPSLSMNYHKLLPDWWMGIYPLTYYFIGAWLSEYRPRVKPLPVFLLLTLHVGLCGAFNYWHSLGTVFNDGPWQGWGALQNVVNSVLVFLLLTCIDSSRWPRRVKRALGYLSGLTLTAYLVSCIFDYLFYPGLNAAVEAVTHRLLYFPLIVPLVAVCSLALAALIDGVSVPILALVDRLGRRFLPAVFGKSEKGQAPTEK